MYNVYTYTSYSYSIQTIKTELALSTYWYLFTDIGGTADSDNFGGKIRLKEVPRTLAISNFSKNGPHKYPKHGIAGI